MSKVKHAAEEIAALVALCSSKDFQKMLFGTYSDGKTRSFIDAWNGEVLSPKQRQKKLYKKRKSGKKKIRL